MGQLVFGPYENSEFDSYYYDDDYTFRVWIPPALLTACSKFRIGFGYYLTNSVYIDKVYVGQSSGSDADYLFDGDPTAVLFSGVAAVTYSSAIKYSDYVEMDIDPTKGLIISMEFGATHSYMPYVEVATGDDADIVTYRDAGDYAALDTFNPDASYPTRRHLVVSVDNVFSLDDDLPNLCADSNVNHAHRSDAISATADIGSGDNGTVTTTVDTAGTDGNNFTIEVVEGVGVDVPMSAALVGQDITVTLGTDGAGVLDATKNTAILIAAAVDALDDVSSAESGTGADALTAAEGPTSFTGGVDQWRGFNPTPDLQATGEVEWLYLIDTLPDLQISAFGKIGFIDLDDGVLPDLQCTGRFGYNANLGRDETANLPDLRLTAQFGERASLEATLPDLDCVGYAGARGGENKLPVLECSGTVLSGQTASLNEILPDLDCVGYTGARGGTLTLPDLQISASGSGVFMRLEEKLPPLMIEAEGSTPTTATLEADLTFPTFEGVMSLDCRGNLDATLPNLKIAATAHGPRTMNLDATLPDLKIQADLRREVTGNLDANLPGLTLEASGHGSPTISLESDLPNLKLSATGYSPRTLTLDATLPDLRLEAELIREVTGSLDAILPGLRIDAEAHCVPEISLESDLSNLKLSATAHGPRTLNLDATLPDLKIEAELRREITGGLDATLPGLRLEGAAHCDLDTISLDANLPNLKLSATGLSGETAELEATLPNLKISASALSGDILTLSATLPALVMGDTRTGGTGGESGSMANLGRFTDYTLRHSR